MSQESSCPPNQTACPLEGVPRPSVAAIESMLDSTPMDGHDSCRPTGEEDADAPGRSNEPWPA